MQQEVKVSRDAEIGTDHLLVIEKVRLNIKKRSRKRKYEINIEK